MSATAKPFRVVVRVRNNRLIRLREELQMTAPQIAKAIGVNYYTYSALEGLRASAFNTQRGEWSVSACRIAKFHGVSEEYIWPEEVREMKAKAFELLATAEELVGSIPDREMEAIEVKRLLTESAAGVPAIDLPALRATVMEDHTLRDAGHIAPGIEGGSSGMNVRRRVDRAVHIMRHSRAGRILQKDYT